MSQNMMGGRRQDSHQSQLPSSEEGNLDQPVGSVSDDHPNLNTSAAPLLTLDEVRCGGPGQGAGTHPFIRARASRSR